MKNWKHYQEIDSNIVHASNGKNTVEVTLTLSRNFTGRSRVFVGFSCSIEGAGISIRKENGGSLYLAMISSAAELKELMGYELNIWGLHPDYTESGHSENTSWGWNRHQQVRIIAQVED